MLSKEEIRKKLYEGSRKGCSHMLVVCDKWDYSDYFVYVPIGEEIHDYINKYDCSSMQEIMEIYNYQMDLESQLNEIRAWHGQVFSTEKQITIEEQALNYATYKHQDQYRKNGKEYITHPIRVGELLLEFKDSHNIKVLQAVAYLHDVLEDTKTTYYDLVDYFGSDITNMIMELTTNVNMKNAIGKKNYLAYKLNSMTKWSLTIKLCDRLANIEDLEGVTLEFKKRYIDETKYIINYLYENRELTKTQLKIIESIKNKLECLNYEESNYKKILIKK